MSSTTDLQCAVCDEKIPTVHLLEMHYKEVHGANFGDSCEEANSVDFAGWVESVKRDGSKSPVLFFKPRDSDDDEYNVEREHLMLIMMSSHQRRKLRECRDSALCIDTRHYVKIDELFHLTVMVIIDENGEFSPVLFMISNRIDLNAAKACFRVIKKHVGLVRLESLMANDSFTEAWERVMRPVATKLPSTWTYDPEWQVSTFEQECELNVMVRGAFREYRLPELIFANVACMHGRIHDIGLSDTYMDDEPAETMKHTLRVIYSIIEENISEEMLDFVTQTVAGAVDVDAVEAIKSQLDFIKSQKDKL